MVKWMILVWHFGVCSFLDNIWYILPKKYKYYTIDRTDHGQACLHYKTSVLSVLSLILLKRKRMEPLIPGGGVAKTISLRLLAVLVNKCLSQPSLYIQFCAFTRGVQANHSINLFVRFKVDNWFWLKGLISCVADRCL